MIDEPLAEGQVWRHKRERWRLVTVTGVRPRLDEGVDAYVSRNTSRRGQAIQEKTLRREYERIR